MALPVSAGRFSLILESLKLIEGRHTKPCMEREREREREIRMTYHAENRNSPEKQMTTKLR